MRSLFLVWVQQPSSVSTTVQRSSLLIYWLHPQGRARSCFEQETQPNSYCTRAVAKEPHSWGRGGGEAPEFARGENGRQTLTSQGERSYHNIPPQTFATPRDIVCYFCGCGARGKSSAPMTDDKAEDSLIPRWHGGGHMVSNEHEDGRPISMRGTLEICVEPRRKPRRQANGEPRKIRDTGWLREVSEDARMLPSRATTRARPVPKSCQMRSSGWADGGAHFRTERVFRARVAAIG